MFFKVRKVKKQQALFSEALTEAGYKNAGEHVSIDHAGAKCFYYDEVYPIIFPLRFLRESKKLSREKLYDFTFRGLNTAKRDWVKRYNSERAKVTFTDNGRKMPKDEFDVVYYQEMCSSRFTLCPAGDFKWTYRFLEAIMCHSIPVIEPGSDHPQFDGFRYFYSDMISAELVQVYDRIIAEQNYRLFIKRHTFVDRFVFF